MSASRKAFFRIPLFGWLLKDAVYGPPDAKYYFMWNLLVVVALAVYAFGYPLLITMCLMAAAAALTMIVVLTASDLFDAKSRAVPAAASANRTPRRQS
ncbi:MAG TPA: hypothetical protein VG986_15695 [Pseudolabrys sp.]|nr:hypothetical protein [Pseudolabrys sp.]